MPWLPANQPRWRRRSTSTTCRARPATPSPDPAPASPWVWPIGWIRWRRSSRWDCSPQARATRTDCGGAPPGFCRSCFLPLCPPLFFSPPPPPRRARPPCPASLPAREEYLLLDRGHRHDVVEAVVAAQGHDPAGAARAAVDLEAGVRQEDWPEVLHAFARCARITRVETKKHTLKPEALADPDSKA